MKTEVALHLRLTKPQKEAIKSKSHFQLLTGVAGTGKTYVAIARALQMLRDEEVEQIVIVRSAVAVRAIGFLPGDEEEKSDPYAQPYIDLIKLISPRTPYKMMVAKKVLTFTLTSFLRGITFENACVIIDEYQNMSAHELQTIVTRVGQNTRLIVCGDSDQSDLPNHEKEAHRSVIGILTHMPEFHVVTFGVNDIVRSPFVASFYRTKQRMETGVMTDSVWKVPAFLNGRATPDGGTILHPPS